MASTRLSQVKQQRIRQCKTGLNSPDQGHENANFQRVDGQTTEGVSVAIASAARRPTPPGCSEDAACTALPVDLDRPSPSVGCGRWRILRLETGPSPASLRNQLRQRPYRG